MGPKYDLEALAQKIDHEGGIYEALLYGIRPEDVPEEIRDDWRVLLVQFQAAEDTWREIQKQLPDPW